MKNISRPNEISRGLQDRHIAIWQSHGNYFKNDKNEWGWQRPRLFCTTEDMFTQSFVLPYVIPMLENAGAIVYTPRERDTQKNEDHCRIMTLPMLPFIWKWVAKKLIGQMPR